MWLFFLCVFTVLVVVFVHELSFAPSQILHSPIPETQQSEHVTNPDFHNGHALDIYIIGLEKNRKSHFEPLQKRLRAQGLVVNYVEGINGRNMKLEEHQHLITARYKNFFVQNQKDIDAGIAKTRYLGHLACSLTHVSVIERMRESTISIIFEEDVDLPLTFCTRLHQFLRDMDSVDPKYVFGLLGFCAQYNHHPYHKLNDQECLHLGWLARVHAWIGGWGILYNFQHSKPSDLLGILKPLNWHIDLAISDIARLNDAFRAYGAIPPLVKHPGLLRISAWDETQIGDTRLLKTDTNIPV